MKPLSLSILILFLITSCVYPQDSGENIDWNEVDYYLFNSLKEEFEQGEAEIYQAIGFVHIKQENWKRAATYFKKAVSLNPKLYWSWYNLGLLHIDTEEGNKYLKKAIEADPDYPPPYYWLAYCYCKHRREKQAIKIFKKYLEVAEDIPSETPRNRRARRILAELFSGREGEELWKIRKLNW
ncbi:MAG: tetratricopeptide repeat protein [Candidatus Omnitrophica bacterium]|nr:tetratricopeptide repeat protein [Candidatus Omnitrophota bacterium]